MLEMVVVVSRTARALLVLALVLPLCLSAWWFSRRPRDGFPSQFDAALDRALAPVLEMHAASVKLGASTPAQARVLARQLAQDSVVYLAPADLELWAAIRLEAAHRSSAACARLWRGGDESPIREAIVELGEERLAGWTEMLARGFALRLERKQPPDAPADAVPRAMAAIVHSLPEEQQEAFVVDVRRRDLADDRACQLFIELSTQARQLAPAERVTLYRALAQQLRPSLLPTPSSSTR